ncbi:MAG TPA: metal-dependent hydrolase [Pyrinomonadaceae bacterium]|nr:metal-dependent hydrolase [Pyrinomonadaceae bacterium]
MDPFTHTLVGLTAAKAGLERLSPLATTVCMLAANSPDSDVVVGFVTDRWTYLHHHRGITHSIVGVMALAFIVPTLIWLGERLFARLRGTGPRTRFRGLLLASLIMTATHPLLDWTNNYGVRPFLPWSGRWFYGDLVFIVDPYILLLVGGAAFLATRRGWPKMVVWALLATAFVGLTFLVASRPDPSLAGINIARVVLLVGVLSLVVVRVLKLSRGRERTIAVAALAGLVIYWGALGLAHRAALNHARDLAARSAGPINERVLRVAAMPTLANPLRWSCVAETDRAIYRYFVSLTDSSSSSPAIVSGYQHNSPDASPSPPPSLNGYEHNSPESVFKRYEKPTGRAAELSALAAEDRRARILLNFARFPIARVQDENCVSQTIVQIADLRYTEPGATRGTFSLNVPVECASK